MDKYTNNLVPKFIDSEWLANHLENRGINIIDASVIFAEPEKDFIQSGYQLYQKRHIPGAIFADLLQANLTNSSIPFTYPGLKPMIEFISRLGISPDQHQIIYDSGPQYGVDFKADSWASRLAWQLEAIGFNKVSVLEGGINKWIAESKPLSSRIEKAEVYQARNLTPRNLFSTQEDVLHSLNDPQIVTIDVLDEDQYKGITYPFGQERAGHIPNAVNIFYGSLTDKNGSLLETEKLREIFNHDNILDQDKEVIVYCGFGVAATYVARVIQSLGQDQVRVYDGSLQEWAQSSELPLEIVKERYM